MSKNLAIPTMPTILAAIVVAGIMTSITAVPATAQHCVTVGCTTQCWPTPGGRRCQWWCRRRCYNPPQYVPPPVYDPPAYVEPVRHYAPGPSPEDRAILGIILMVVLIVIAAACSSEGTTAIERDEKQTRALVSKLDDAAREADAHIAAFLEQERRKERHHG